MSHQDDRMVLPPPRPAQRRARNNLLWTLVTLIALVAGAVGGVWLGKSVRDDASSGPAGNPGTVQVSLSAELEQTLAEARIALAEREWLEARRLYEDVLQNDPDNVEATTSLPLIQKHLQSVGGKVVIETEPTSALVRIAGRDPVRTPAEIADLPVGETEIRIEKEGYETVKKVVMVQEKETTTLPLVTMQKSQGQLELVSEPEGAEFKILKTTKENPRVPVELVQIGKTPAKVESLEAGEYEIAITWQERDTFRATNAPYKAYDASNPTVFSSTTVDQTAAPVADYLRGGEPFQVIFPAVEVTSGTLIVELSDDANDFVIADAVRIELLGPDENPPVADLANPADGSTISPAILNARGYIEVTFSDSGDGVNESTIGGDEISLTGSGVNVGLPLSSAYYP